MRVRLAVGLAAGQPAVRRASWLVLLLALAPAVPALAKGDGFVSPPAPGTPGLLRGPARVVDGDTIEIGGVRIRLHGVDSPERGQTCTWDRRRMDCFAAAGQALDYLVARSEVLCEPIGDAGFGRIAARCWVRRTELGAWMVWAGWAVVAERYTRDPQYLRFQAEARAERRGVWRDPRFIPPDEWRAGRRR